MTQMLLGWSIDQWALACAGKDIKTFPEAVQLRKEYKKTHKYDPIEKGVIITASGKDEREKNYESAFLIFESAMLKKFEK